METKNLGSWNEFELEIEELLSSHQVRKHDKPNLVDNILFRGHSDSRWDLLTTMERSMGEKQKLSSYHLLMSNILPSVEAFTGKIWDIPEYPDYINKMTSPDSMSAQIQTNILEFMVYLRHYGFPSPLLDWTMSPYVAAYFAFRDILSNANEVAIFAYIEHLGIKSGWGAGPNIRRLGQYLKSDKRHFLQQCNYTMCLEVLEINNKQTLLYGSHQEVFSKPSKRQDIFIKYILPARERSKALRKLEILNINAFSLFGSEESLMETVFLREFYLQKQ